MIDIDRWLQCNHVEFGREWPDVDCYGLARLVRAEHGRELMPMHMIGHGDGPAISREANHVAANVLQECEPKPGALVLCWRGRACIHIAVCVRVDRRLKVLDTDIGRGPRLTPVRRFETQFVRVGYYD